MASSRIRLALLIGALAALASTGIAAQQSTVTFEVAAIYPVPPDAAAAAGRSAGRPSRMMVTPSRVEITNLSLREIVRRAFDVRPYELIAPDWMDELHFDIQATLPSGAVRDQVPEMLQALLSARFQPPL